MPNRIDWLIDAKRFLTEVMQSRHRINVYFSISLDKRPRKWQRIEVHRDEWSMRFQQVPSILIPSWFHE